MLGKIRCYSKIQTLQFISFILLNSLRQLSTKYCKPVLCKQKYFDNIVFFIFVIFIRIIFILFMFSFTTDQL